MRRLIFTLAISHLLLAGGGVSLYVDPSLMGAALIAAGTFVGWMVPHRATDAKADLSTYLKAGSAVLLTKWLINLGLLTFLEKAWDERFAILPILAFTLALSYLIISDWMRFMTLSPEDITRFYETRR